MAFLIPAPVVLRLFAQVDGQRQKELRWRKPLCWLSCWEALPGELCPCGAEPGAQRSHAAGCQSSSVLSVRQRCMTGFVGQLALNKIIMDKYMKRVAKVSCLFYNWWTQVFWLCYHMLFLPCVGTHVLQDQLNPLIFVASCDIRNKGWGSLKCWGGFWVL